MLTAINNPPVYKRLISDYNGKVLPSNDEMFTNLLMANYGMIKNSAEAAVKVFTRNAKSLGIIDHTNRLRYLLPVINNNTSHINQEAQKLDDGKTFQKPPVIDDNMFEQPIDLGEKTAYLKYPRNITTDEIEILKIMLDATMTALSARKKKAEIKNPAEAGSIIIAI